MQKILVLTPPLGGVCRGLLHGCENFADLRFQMYCEIGGVSGEDIICVGARAGVWCMKMTNVSPARAHHYLAEVTRLPWPLHNTRATVQVYANYTQPFTHWYKHIIIISTKANKKLHNRSSLNQIWIHFSATLPEILSTVYCSLNLTLNSSQHLFLTSIDVRNRVRDCIGKHFLSFAHL